MKPLLAVTMGDPAGIGPEIVLRALAAPHTTDSCRIVVYGDIEVLQAAARQFQLPMPPAVIQATDAHLQGLKTGCIQPEAGRAAWQSVECAARAALCGEVDALVTAPLHKEALALAKCPYPGHTELLAAAAETENVGMMLQSGSLRVIHVSTHVSLRQALQRVQTSRILSCIEMAEEACAAQGIAQPCIAVAGLNPHAGEGGLFGEEEQEIILPAVQLALQKGIRAAGPLSPDTVFARAAAGDYDAVVAMYHDQGHIPVKLHGFDTGVNITLGLPFPRTSPDHGTAFDIAGKGLASEASLCCAIQTAVQLCKNRPCSKNI